MQERICAPDTKLLVVILHPYNLLVYILFCAAVDAVCVHHLVQSLPGHKYNSSMHAGWSLEISEISLSMLHFHFSNNLSTAPSE